MKLTRAFSLIAVFSGLTLCVGLGAFAQAPAPCQPPVTEVVVYDFVPEAQLQSTDFRPLMKSETGFIQKLREADNFEVTDLTTQILPPEIVPDPPRISSELQPPPAQLQEPYFFYRSDYKNRQRLSARGAAKKVLRQFAAGRGKNAFSQRGRSRDSR